MTAQVRCNARPVLDQSLKDNLRASHWGFGACHPAERTQNENDAHRINNQNKAGFVTSNMLQYKWVQPYKAK